jgi:predicted RNA-binding Zn-ribbon protein involved in translation (DUF1610 family)
MAQAIEILLWCDACLAEDDAHTPAQTLTVPALPERPAFEVEACERHAAALMAAVEALRDYGRPVGKAAPGKAANGQRGASTGPRKADQQPGTGDTCPTCGYTSKTRAMLRAHLRNVHDQSLADAGLAPAKYTCPECGSKFDAGQGFSAHLRALHGLTLEQARQSA